jgi:hypothetical protein
MLSTASSDCRRSVGTVDSQPRRGSPGVAVVDGGRVFGVLPQRRASTGGATPSRLAAAMERDSVGQTFLSALVDARRQECPRHSGRHLSLAIDPVATCRYLSPPVGSTGSTGSTGARERGRGRGRGRKATHQLSCCFRQSVGTKCGDKVLERSTHLNSALKLTLQRHAYSTSLIFHVRRRRQSYRQSLRQSGGAAPPTFREPSARPLWLTDCRE